MKKTTCIQLVLITAALAGCERGAYVGGPTRDRVVMSDRAAMRDQPMMGDPPDSTNSCPLEQSALPPDYYLWYSGLRPDEYYFAAGLSLQGYYNYRCPVRVVRVIRAGFGRIAAGRVGSGVHA